jgi:hypothetical protein
MIHSLLVSDDVRLSSRILSTLMMVENSPSEMPVLTGSTRSHFRALESSLQLCEHVRRNQHQIPASAPLALCSGTRLSSEMYQLASCF